MKQHDAVWTASVEAHIRQQKAGPYDSEESLQNKVEAGIFARVIQNIEDVCLDKARRVLRSEGWTARSWQQDGLLVEGQLRAWECDGWSGNVSAKLRLETKKAKSREARPFAHAHAAATLPPPTQDRFLPLRQRPGSACAHVSTIRYHIGT